MAQNPIRPTDDAARALARGLVEAARFAALGVFGLDGRPLVTRIAFGTDAKGVPLSLMSQLSEHTRALTAHAECSILVGEPGPRGDPLTHPRLTLQARATFVAHGTQDYADLAGHYLQTHPKAKLYIGFGDFLFARFDVSAAYLNGGFGKAFHLEAQDLAADQGPAVS